MPPSLLPTSLPFDGKLDKYAPCVSLIDDVFRLKARGLLVAGYAAAVMLAWFGSLMYLVERDDNEVQVWRRPGIMRQGLRGDGVAYGGGHV